MRDRAVFAKPLPCTALDDDHALVGQFEFVEQIEELTDEVIDVAHSPAVGKAPAEAGGSGAGFFRIKLEERFRRLFTGRLVSSTGFELFFTPIGKQCTEFEVEEPAIIMLAILLEPIHAHLEDGIAEGGLFEGSQVVIADHGDMLPAGGVTQMMHDPMIGKVGRGAAGGCQGSGEFIECDRDAVGY